MKTELYQNTNMSIIKISARDNRSFFRRGAHKMQSLASPKFGYKSGASTEKRSTIKWLWDPAAAQRRVKRAKRFGLDIQCNDEEKVQEDLVWDEEE